MKNATITGILHPGFKKSLLSHTKLAYIGKVDQLEWATCSRQVYTKANIIIHPPCHNIQENISLLLKSEKFGNKCESPKKGSQFITQTMPTKAS